MKSRISLAVFITGSILIIVASVLSGAGFFKKPVAVVEGERIEQETFKRAFIMRTGAHKARGVAIDEGMLKRAVLNELMDDILILKEAKKKGIGVSDAEVREMTEAIKKRLPPGEFEKQLKSENVSYDDFLGRVRNGMIIEKFEKGLVVGEVSDEEAKKLYELGYQPVTKPERTKMRLMEFRTREEAEKTAGEMKKKAIPFDRMAAELEKNKLATVSFSGWVQSGVFSPQMAAAIRDIGKGGYGGPVQGKDGWYIIKVEDREPAKVASFEESKEQIKPFILERKQREALIRWVDNRRQSAKIIVNEKLL